jgi:hypothetical protein
MSEQIAFSEVTGPLGAFEVSTIRTLAGGAPSSPPIGFFSESDFDSYLIWPFETMVFRPSSRRGLYHAAYSTKEEALAGHTQITETIRRGSEFGGGVNEDGEPSLTAEEWALRMTAKGATCA